MKLFLKLLFIIFFLSGCVTSEKYIKLMNKLEPKVEECLPETFEDYINNVCDESK